MLIWANHLADQTQNCNSAILHISVENPQILLLRQTLDLGTQCESCHFFKERRGLQMSIFLMVNSRQIRTQTHPIHLDTFFSVLDPGNWH